MQDIVKREKKLEGSAVEISTTQTKFACVK